MSQNEINYKTNSATILSLMDSFEKKRLNLNPGFQRKSVWVEKDRSKLIDSIIRNYPIPAIFLYKRKNDNGELIYDVIDGKQRLESIFMFTGLMKGKFISKTTLPENNEEIEIDWNYLKKRKLQSLIEERQIATIEVDGNIGDIIDVFVRINSTGKSLTNAEKQHAKYSKSPFLKLAIQIASKYEKYFVRNGIISSNQVSRMKHVELVCEIMFSIYKDDVINKKAALDSIMDKRDLTQRQLTLTKTRTIKAINRVAALFPKLDQTRFNKLSDYYILVFLIAKYEADGYILLDKKRNRLANEILVEFSKGIDVVREKQRKFKTPTLDEQMYVDYLLTVAQATDEKSQRSKRMKIIDGLFNSLFAVKDTQRIFSTEQRRILWHSSGEKKCTYPGCKTVLGWNDFTIDHIDSHSRGGKSILKNAALMCQKHNSKKGNRKR
jgi:hypothetical protein